MSETSSAFAKFRNAVKKAQEQERDSVPSVSIHSSVHSRKQSPPGSPEAGAKARPSVLKRFNFEQEEPTPPPMSRAQSERTAKKPPVAAQRQGSAPQLKREKEKQEKEKEKEKEKVKEKKDKKKEKEKDREKEKEKEKDREKEKEKEKDAPVEEKNHFCAVSAKEAKEERRERQQPLRTLVEEGDAGGVGMIVLERATPSISETSGTMHPSVSERSQRVSGERALRSRASTATPSVCSSSSTSTLATTATATATAPSPTAHMSRTSQATDMSNHQLPPAASASESEFVPRTPDLGTFVQSIAEVSLGTSGKRFEESNQQSSTDASGRLDRAVGQVVERKLSEAAASVFGRKDVAESSHGSNLKSRASSRHQFANLENTSGGAVNVALAELNARIAHLEGSLVRKDAELAAAQADHEKNCSALMKRSEDKEMAIREKDRLIAQLQAQLDRGECARCKGAAEAIAHLTTSLADSDTARMRLAEDLDRAQTAILSSDEQFMKTQQKLHKARESLAAIQQTCVAYNIPLPEVAAGSPPRHQHQHHHQLQQLPQPSPAKGSSSTILELMASSLAEAEAQNYDKPRASYRLTEGTSSPGLREKSTTGNSGSVARAYR